MFLKEQINELNEKVKRLQTENQYKHVRSDLILSGREPKASKSDRKHKKPDFPQSDSHRPQRSTFDFKQKYIKSFNLTKQVKDLKSVIKDQADEI